MLYLENEDYGTAVAISPGDGSLSNSVSGTKLFFPSLTFFPRGAPVIGGWHSDGRRETV